MYKVGDKVVCIRADQFKKPIAHGLTEGKTYTVLEIRSNQTMTGKVSFVEDDFGMSVGFTFERFISISEYRKRKLQKICSRLAK